MIISTHDHFNSGVKKDLHTNFFYFFLSLLQKMKNNNGDIINKKLRIMTTVKKFKEKMALHGHKTTERELKFIEKAVKFHEDLANDEDEDDIVYLNDCLIYLDNLFNDFVIENNTDQMSEEPIINNSTFIETPEWLKLKRSVLNPRIMTINVFNIL